MRFQNKVDYDKLQDLSALRRLDEDYCPKACNVSCYGSVSTWKRQRWKLLIHSLTLQILIVSRHFVSQTFLFHRKKDGKIKTKLLFDKSSTRSSNFNHLSFDESIFMFSIKLHLNYHSTDMFNLRGSRGCSTASPFFFFFFFILIIIALEPYRSEKFLQDKISAHKKLLNKLHRKMLQFFILSAILESQKQLPISFFLATNWKVAMLRDDLCVLWTDRNLAS